MKKKKMNKALISVLLSALLMMSGTFQALASDVKPPTDNDPDVVEAVMEEDVQAEQAVIPEVEPASEPAPTEVKAPVAPAIVEQPADLILEEEVVLPAPVEEKVPEAVVSVQNRERAPPLVETKDRDHRDCDLGIGSGLDPKWDWDWDWNWDRDWDWDIDCDLDLDFNWGKCPDLKCNCFVTLEFEKIWHGNNLGYKKFVIMDLYANDKLVAHFPISHATNWKVKFRAPRHVLGKDIVYTAKEKAIDGYKTVVEKDGYKFKIHNYQKVGKLHVEKRWDNEDRLELRPEVIDYQLLKNGEVQPEIYELTKDNGWVDVVDIDMFDDENEVIVYGVQEVFIDGYFTTYEEGEGVYHSKGKCCPVKENIDYYITIINHWTNEKEITLEKIWETNEDAMVPEEVTFMLYQNGEEYESYVVEKDMDWKKFIDIPLYDDDNELYVYTLLEVDVPQGYESTVDGFVVTNTWVGEDPDLDEKIVISGEKTWLDDGTGRPDNITVNLMQGDNVVESIVVSPVDGKWAYTFKAVPKFDEDEMEIEYTVTEEEIDGYMMVSNQGYNLVNVRVGFVTVNGEKTWDDLMNRPEMITVKLLRNGEEVDEKEVKAGTDGKWMFEFADLDKFDENGMAYTYTVDEAKVAGYSVEVNGFNLKNYQKRGVMVLNKVDENKVGLPGAVFALYDLEGNLIKTFTTGADGKFEMTLPLGMYRLSEVTAPKGYNKKAFSRLVVLVRDGDTVSIEIENTKIENGFQPLLPDTGGGTSGGGSYKPILPSTGSTTQPMLYILGLFSLFVGASELGRKKKMY